VNLIVGVNLAWYRLCGCALHSIPTPQVSKTELTQKVEWSGGKSVGELLLEPTTIYVTSVLKLAEKLTVKVGACLTPSSAHTSNVLCEEEGGGRPAVAFPVRTLPSFVCKQISSTNMACRCFLLVTEG